MAKEQFQYKVYVKNFSGLNNEKGLEVAFNSDFELDEREIGNKVMSEVVKQYNSLAHEYNDKSAYDKLMNTKGVKAVKELERNVVAIQHEVVVECETDEFE